MKNETLRYGKRVWCLENREYAVSKELPLVSTVASKRPLATLVGESIYLA